MNVLSALPKTSKLYNQVGHILEKAGLGAILSKKGIFFEKRAKLEISYKGHLFACDYRTQQMHGICPAS